MASAIGLSQSAFSRLEAGESVLNLSQLRNVAAHLKMRPAELLKLADRYEELLRQQGVDVISEKQDESAAIVLGLGLLGALLLAAR
jgi:transcriptional regulator with XRE-family HTH domain